MAITREEFFNKQANASLWDVAVSIKRGNPLPLDADSIFESYEALESYAADVLAYPGQIVAVVEEDATGIYYLDQNCAIQPVGVIPAGDDKSIEVSEDSVFSLHNFGKAFYKYIPEEKNETGEVTKEASYEKVEVSESNPWKAGLEPKVTTEEGKLVIGWFEPNPTTIEGVNDQVTAVQGTVADLETSVGAPSEGDTPATGLYKEVEDVQAEVETLTDEVGTSEDALGDNVNTIWANVNDHTARLETLEAKEESVLGIAANDKILTLGADKLISAAVSMSYDEENKAIKLYGKDNTELGSVDATPFIKDGMLDDVEYNPDNNTLTFTWNTEAGPKTDEVVLSDIIEAYTAGAGLELAGNEFAVKIATDSEGFLTADANGIKVSGIQDAIDAAKGEAATDAQSKADAAKQAAIDDAATKYATTGALSELETAIDGRLDTLEAIDHTLYATKAELEPVATAASNAETAVGNLEQRFDEIVAVGGEPNAINKIQVNGKELTITEKTVNIEVPTALSGLEGWTALDERVTAAKTQADKGVDEAGKANAAAASNAEEIGKHETRIGTLETTKGDHETRILNLENANSTHASEYSALKTTVDGHTETIAKKADQTVVDGVLAKASANETAIQTLNETTIPGLSTEIGKKANAVDVYTKTEVGTITEGKTLVEMINEAKSEASYDDTEVRGLIGDNANAIAAIYTAGTEGTAATGVLATEITRVEGLLTAETSRADAAEKALDGRLQTVETFFAAVETPDATIDTLAEIVKYIEDDKSGAEGMLASIQANEKAIKAIYTPADGETPAEGLLVSEIARVEGLTTTNAQAIAAINHSETGILATAKKYTDDQIATIPVAGALLGLVKSSEDDNKIKVEEDGTMSVNRISTDKLYVAEGSELILNGGSAN